MRKLILAAITLTVVVIASTQGNAQTCLTVADLKRMSECELERLFEQSTVGEMPVGFGRGEVLLMVDKKHPRLNARMQSCVWKGKHFDCNGDFINQFPGFKAVRGHAGPSISTHDGKPCISISYPPGAPIFGNTRDEMREVAPGLFLCRLYETCPCPHFRGYFTLQITCGCK